MRHRADASPMRRTDRTLPTKRTCAPWTSIPTPPRSAAIRQLVLDISYNLTQSTEASIVTVLSPTGIDFTRKSNSWKCISREMERMFPEALDTPRDTQMNVAIGQINEDAGRYQRRWLYRFVRRQFRRHIEGRPCSRRRNPAHRRP